MRSQLPDKVATAARRKRPRTFLRLSDDPDTRSTQIGVGATILIHLLLFAILPNKMDNDLVGSFLPQHRAASQKTFNIEIAPDAFPMVKTPAPTKSVPTKFVETNPDAPDNEPDKTDNFGAQNQQAAQETKAKQTGGDRPEMEGRKDIESTQVVTGRLTDQQAPPQPSAPAAPETPPVTEPATPMVQREQNPLPGIEKYTGDSKESYGSNIAKIAPHPEDVKGKVDGSPNAPLTNNASGTQMAVDRNHPRPRPQLERKARPALFAENKIGTANIGPMAIDARWSSYGQYLQKMLETVQMQWEKMIIEGKTYPSAGSIVTVKFIMDSQGAITRVMNVEGGMSGTQAEGYCVAAITKPSPFGKWSDDMVAVLGQQQEMTFAFYYQ